MKVRFATVALATSLVSANGPFQEVSPNFDTYDSSSMSVIQKIENEGLKLSTEVTEIVKDKENPMLVDGLEDISFEDFCKGLSAGGASTDIDQTITKPFGAEEEKLALDFLARLKQAGDLALNSIIPLSRPKDRVFQDPDYIEDYESDGEVEELGRHLQSIKILTAPEMLTPPAMAKQELYYDGPTQEESELLLSWLEDCDEDSIRPLHPRVSYLRR